jgi:hypothetical protein
MSANHPRSLWEKGVKIGDGGPFGYVSSDMYIFRIHPQSPTPRRTGWATFVVGRNAFHFGDASLFFLMDYGGLWDSHCNCKIAHVRIVATIQGQCNGA